MKPQIKQLIQAVFDINKIGARASVVETEKEVLIKLVSNKRCYILRILKSTVNADFEVQHTIEFLNEFANNNKEAA